MDSPVREWEQRELNNHRRRERRRRRSRAEQVELCSYLGVSVPRGECCRPSPLVPEPLPIGLVDREASFEELPDLDHPEPAQQQQQQPELIQVWDSSDDELPDIAVQQPEYPPEQLHDPDPLGEEPVEQALEPR